MRWLGKQIGLLICCAFPHLLVNSARWNWLLFNSTATPAQFNWIKIRKNGSKYMFLTHEDSHLYMIIGKCHMATKWSCCFYYIRRHSPCVDVHADRFPVFSQKKEEFLCYQEVKVRMQGNMPKACASFQEASHGGHNLNAPLLPHQFYKSPSNYPSHSGLKAACWVNNKYRVQQLSSCTE